MMARRLAVQYGDCLALNEFWRDSIHVYNNQGKVKLKSKTLRNMKIFQHFSGNTEFSVTERPQQLTEL